MGVKDKREKERELVQGVLRKDEKAVEELYRQYFPGITVFVYGKIDNPFDAQEIVQDIFISALDCLPLFSFKSSLSTWLYAIAKHEVIDFYRKKKIKAVLFSRLPILETLASRALGPEEKLIEKEIKSQIMRVFSRLSEGYRKILRLKYVEGYSVAQIANMLEISAKAAESRLTRARLAFRKVWADNNFQFSISNFQSISNDSISKHKEKNLSEIPS